MNKQKTIPTTGTKIHRNQSVKSCQDSDKTSSDEHTSDSEEFDAFFSMTLVDFTKLEEPDTPELRAIHREFDEMYAKTRSTRKASTASETVDLANKKDENCAKKAPQCISTMKMSKTKLDTSATSSISSPATKLTANDRRAKPKRPTMNGQSTAQQRPTVAPKDELNRLRNKADQSQKCANLSTSKTKLLPAVLVKNEEIYQLKKELAVVNSQLTEAHHELHMQKENESNLRAAMECSYKNIKVLSDENRNLRTTLENQQARIQELLQDCEHTEEELRLYKIDLREVVDENSQLLRELHGTQIKLQKVEFAQLQDLEDLKAQNIRLQAEVEELNNRVHPSLDTNLAQVESYEARIQELLQDCEHTEEELRLYKIDLREVVDENSQLLRELHGTQIKLQKVETMLREVEFVKPQGFISGVMTLAL
ncbi:unnamed protein product [Aphanomyces euteiches]